MDKVNMKSMDIVGNNIEKIGQLFPNCITEVKNDKGELEHAIDFDKLKQELSRNLVEGKKERYEFTWPDKRQAIVTANAPISKTLRPVREKSVDFDNTQNVYIEGDNLDALKLLQETYLGKIKMIYIDPPYNTGNDFVYEDDFSQNAEDYMKLTGDADEQGNRLTANKDSNGRFHTDWLNMMYPRLKLAKDLLTEDGIIMISIDDCEVKNLRQVCDEIFGKCNFIDTLIWKKRYGGGAKEKYFVSLQEYILTYCNDINRLNDLYIPLSNDSVDRYYTKKDSKFETRGPYRTHPLEAGKAMDERPNLVFPIAAPDGTNVFPKKQWLWCKERVLSAIENDEIEFSNNGSEWVVSSKQYLREENGEIRSAKMLSIIDDIYTQHGTNEMIKIFGNAKIFQYPKPSELIKKLISVITENKNETILDFFSGSASTAHAVMKLNAEDGGNRKFIMVQLPEVCDEKSEAMKAGYNTICDIGEERIRRAGKKIKEEAGLMADGLDVGFRVFKIDESNMKDVYYNPEDIQQDLLLSVEDNIKEDRTPEDLLFQVMIDDFGIPLSAKIEKLVVSGKTIFNVDDAHLVTCFDSGVTDGVVTAMAKLEPNYAVLRDSSYADDSVAANFEQIFNKYSPNTTRKVL